MIDLVSAGILLAVGMCIPKICRMLLPSRQKITRQRLYLLNHRLDTLNLYLKEKEVDIGFLERHDADEYSALIQRYRRLTTKMKGELR